MNRTRHPTYAASIFFALAVASGACGGEPSAGDADETASGSGSSGGASGAGGSGVVPPTGGMGSGAPMKGPFGVWHDVTPPGLVFGTENDHFGAQDILADPVRPGDFYAFICFEGVWKSTDYGLHWEKVSAEGSPMDQGKPWGEAIDPNPSRDPSTPPTMYGTAGNGPAGIFKSVDGGVTWTSAYEPPNGYASDPYMVDIDPEDSQHLLVTFHNDNHIAESKDGGATWIGRGSVAGSSSSAYIFFVTSTTWLLVSQRTDVSGTYRTDDSGATWSKVSDVEHSHGGSQLHVGANGLVYLPGETGIVRSTDFGKTWTQVANLTDNSVVQTKKFLYAMNGGYDQLNLLRSPVDDGATWSSYGDPPAEMYKGTKRVAVATDGKHAVMVSGNWDAGIWRYVEP
jgi:photosystem II stability/assembly factor-like uncharacterized protein